MDFIIKTFTNISTLAQNLIEPIDVLPEFLKDALIDSLNLVPFLFVIFVLIEILEHYFSKKKHLIVFFMKKIGPVFGSLFSSIPQCGFSVVASTLYVRRILSRGTIVAVYLATSDEAIPVLLAEPTNAKLILPIIILKIIVAIIVGYLVDWIISYKASEPEIENFTIKHNHSKDCNKAENPPKKLRQAIKTFEFWKHPIKHTINIFIFILIVSVALSYFMEIVGTEENMAKYCLLNSPLQPFLVSILGLIPNCAVSVGITLLYINHTISFGALIAGLCSSAGLGMLILLNKNKDKLDTFIIITTLIFVSSILGLILQYNVFGINKIFQIFGIEV